MSTETGWPKDKNKCTARGAIAKLAEAVIEGVETRRKSKILFSVEATPAKTLIVWTDQKGFARIGWEISVDASFNPDLPIKIEDPNGYLQTYYIGTYWDDLSETCRLRTDENLLPTIEQLVGALLDAYDQAH